MSAPAVLLEGRGYRGGRLPNPYCVTSEPVSERRLPPHRPGDTPYNGPSAARLGGLPGTAEGLVQRCRWALGRVRGGHRSLLVDYEDENVIVGVVIHSKRDGRGSCTHQRVAGTIAW